MEKDTFLYGCRSGIQKAVRRGEVSLAYTCFSSLWREETHRKWLVNRIPILAVEDAWHMAWDVGRTYASLRGVLYGSKDHVDKLLRLVMRLTVAVKNQDAGWLWSVAKDGPECDHPEWWAMRELVLAAKAAGGPGKRLSSRRVAEVLAASFPGRELNDVERAAVEAAEKRRLLGGWEWDPLMCLATQVLVYNRGLDVAELEAMLDRQKAIYAGEEVEFLPELPWYVFDGHTRPGKLAMRVWFKQEEYEGGLEKDKLEEFWFRVISAKLGDRVKPVFRSWREVKKPHWGETIWADENVRVVLGERGKELLSRWGAGQEERAIGLIRWALKKAS